MAKKSKNDKTNAVKRVEPKQIKADKKLKFELTAAEADLIVKSLGELPYKVSNDLIVKLQSQFSKQVK